jgi:hypothetical protein
LTNIGKKVKIMKREVQEVKTEVTTKLLDGWISSLTDCSRSASMQKRDQNCISAEFLLVSPCPAQDCPMNGYSSWVWAPSSSYSENGEIKIFRNVCLLRSYVIILKNTATRWRQINTRITYKLGCFCCSGVLIIRH